MGNTQAVWSRVYNPSKRRRLAQQAVNAQHAEAAAQAAQQAGGPAPAAED